MGRSISVASPVDAQLKSTQQLSKEDLVLSQVGVSRNALNVESECDTFFLASCYIRCETSALLADSLRYLS